MEDFDITLTIPNWLTARRTLGAYWSFRRFYSSVPVILIDDHSDEADKPIFMRVYSSQIYRPEVIYDPDWRKLAEVASRDRNTFFLRLEKHPYAGKGHGNAIDVAVDICKTKWLLHLDSDVRVVKPGLIEKAMVHDREKVAAIGLDKTREPVMPNLHNTCVFYRVDLAKRYQLSFKSIIWDGSRVVGYYPYDEGKAKGKILEAGTEFCGRLSQKRYLIIHEPALKDYFIQLRYIGEDKDEIWDKYF